MTEQLTGIHSASRSIDIGNFNILDFTPFDAPINWPRPRNQEIAQLTAPLLSLTKELLPHIRNDEYSMLVGDDTSGRIPTLILRQIINHVYRQQGKEPIPTVFYSTYGAAECEEAFLATIIKANNNKPGAKALISTEYIWHGNAVSDIGEYLKNVDVDFDIATVSTLDSEVITTRSFPMRDLLSNKTKLFIGTSDHNCPRIYNAEQLTGISRRTLFRRVLPQHREAVLSARQDVNTVANFLISHL